MRFIADFHIHSHYSIATSKKLVPEYLEYWARLKGINVIGTGDCAHPGWLKELQEKLEPAGNGLYKLKDEYKLEESKYLSRKNIPDDVYFIITGEISSIYKKNAKVRKVHNVCVFPDFESTALMQEKLEKIGNIRSDGRPILGLDSKVLLDMLLNTHPDAFLIPAHIWTPWFSVLGSKSGFDSIEECYEDLTPHIFAVETGLSSDPPMNWACSFLDKFRLVSNSDAHSPEKLGREANLFDTEISYKNIYTALKDNKGYIGTIEFYPQEGKYHYDGHRKCEICWDPLQTIEHDGICPVCGKGVTKGVMYRVAELADRDVASIENKNEFHSITQLPDLLAEVYNQKSSKSKRIQKAFNNLVENIGSEFHILLDAQLDEIETVGGELVAEGIRRLRENEIIIEDGYDGEFGRIKVFNEGETAQFTGKNLFSAGDQPVSPKSKGLSVTFDIKRFKELLKTKKNIEPDTTAEKITDKKNKKAASKNNTPKKTFPGNEHTKQFTDEQFQGITHYTGPCMILAGPGSGKTRILTERIKHLVEEKNIAPYLFLVMTFSNKAAVEIRERLHNQADIKGPLVSTFHSFGLSMLKEHYEKTGRKENFTLIDEDEKLDIIKTLINKPKEAKKIATAIDNMKQGIAPDYTGDENIDDILARYDKQLTALNYFDLADLVYQPVMLLKSDKDLAETYQSHYQWLLIDEFQDINSIQYDLVRLLTDYNNPNLFVIGDPNQAIYGFRGSDVRFIRGLEKDYPGLEKILLTKSFRCPDNIMQIAAQVLNKKTTMQGTSHKIKTHIEEMTTDKSEADWIAATIENMMGGVRSFSMDSGMSDGETANDNIGFSDFAILCRSAFMFSAFMKACNDHGIPYQVINTDNFFTREPVYSAIKTMKQVYQNPALHTDTEEELHVEALMAEGTPIAEIILHLLPDIDTDTQKMIERNTKEFQNKYQEFFEHIVLRKGIDDKIDSVEAVSIMTIHAAKGLEFDTVFIPGCEDKLIPFTLFNDKDPAQIQEEERLFYVGITRTKQNLFLSHTKKRSYNNRLLDQKPSPFLQRLQKELLKTHKRESKKMGSTDQDQQLDLFS